jgi:hypothetical protein
MLNNGFYRQTFSNLALDEVSAQLHDLADTYKRKDPLEVSEHPIIYIKLSIN